MKPASLVSFIAIGAYGCSAVIRKIGIPAVWNKGVAFSSFGDKSAIAVGLGFAVLAALTLSAPKKSNWSRRGLILLWGGAFGNLIDRLLYGSVMDYIPIPYWPGGLFVNVADLTLGAGTLCLLWGIVREREESTC